MLGVVHVSHKRGAMLLGQPPQPLVEELPTEQPAFFVPISRALFTDEEHIRQWFARVCATLDHNLTGVLTFETQRHIFDMVRFQLDHDGILAADVKQIIEQHIEGYPSQPGDPPDIGSREFLRILLAARGPKNKSPANEFNLPWLIETALGNLRQQFLTYKGVNDYLKKHHRGYAAKDGESLRKRCKACGVDFMALVRTERARRKAEN